MDDLEQRFIDRDEEAYLEEIATMRTTKDKREIIADWIEAVNTEGRDLTKWELGFMENITKQFERSANLSDRQEEILERIYAEKTP